MNRVAFAGECSKLLPVVSDEMLDSLENFEEDLYEQNQTRNLTRIPKEECWIRHFLDSLLIAPLMPHGANVLDIGCGPGFPSWPLALGRPDLQVMALDSSGKMLDFLRRHPLPNLSIVQDRAESWGVREAFDAVTGRALAPLSIQLELSSAPLKISGMVVPMRTPADLPEIERLAESALRLKLVEVSECELPVAGAKRIFPIFEKVGKTPTRFPRPWAEIRRKPI